MDIDMNNISEVLAAAAARFPTQTADSTVSGTAATDAAQPAECVPVTAAAGSMEASGTLTDLEAQTIVDHSGPATGMDKHLDAIDAHLQQLLETEYHDVADGAWLPVIDELERTRRRFDAFFLRAVAAADQVNAAAPSPLGTRNMQSYLHRGAGIDPSRAKADVAAARALHTCLATGGGALICQAELEAGPLRSLIPVLESGAISIAHVETGVRVLDHLPARMLTAETTEAIGAFLARQGPAHTAREFRQIGTYLVSACDTAVDDHYDAEAFLRRKLTMGTDLTGMVFGTYQLDPAAGAEFRAILEPLAAPAPDQCNPDGTIGGTDDRTPDQRRADAVVELARAAAAYLGIPGSDPAVAQRPAAVADAAVIDGTAVVGTVVGGTAVDSKAVDSTAEREAAARAAQALFGLDRTALDRTNLDLTGLPGGTNPDSAPETTICGPSRAGRLRPGRRTARVTITTTFEQLRTAQASPPLLAAGSLIGAGPPEPVKLLTAQRPEQPQGTHGKLPPANEGKPPPTNAPQRLEITDRPADPFGLGWDRTAEPVGWPGGVGPEGGAGIGWDRTAEPVGWAAGIRPDIRSGLIVPTVRTGKNVPLDPTPSHCDQLGNISPGTLARIACDATFERAVLSAKGAILELGQSVRLASPAQRRAVAVRDGGCIRPGCNRPASWCDVHHVIWYSHGGPTDVDNLADLCPCDHSLIHAGILEATMIDGVPYVRYGPSARGRSGAGRDQFAGSNDWTRNTYFDDLKEAKGLARVIIAAA